MSDPKATDNNGQSSSHGERAKAIAVTRNEGITGIRSENNLGKKLVKPRTKDDIQIVKEVSGPRKKKKYKIEPELVNLLDDEVEVVTPTYHEVDLTTSYDRGGQDSDVEMVNIEAVEEIPVTVHETDSECSNTVVSGETLSPCTTESQEVPFLRETAETKLQKEIDELGSKVADGQRQRGTVVGQQKRFNTWRKDGETEYQTTSECVISLNVPRLPKLTPRPDIGTFLNTASSDLLPLSNQKSTTACSTDSVFIHNGHSPVPLSSNTPVCLESEQASPMKVGRDGNMRSTRISNRLAEAFTSVSCFKHTNDVGNESTILITEDARSIVIDNPVQHSSNSPLSQNANDAQEDSDEVVMDYLSPILHDTFTSAASKKRKRKISCRRRRKNTRRKAENVNGWVKEDKWYIEGVVACKPSRPSEVKVRYKVKWWGWDSKHNSWQYEDDFDSDETLTTFWTNYVTKINSLNAAKERDVKSSSVEMYDDSSYFLSI